MGECAVPKLYSVPNAASIFPSTSFSPPSPLHVSVSLPRVGLISPTLISPDHSPVSKLSTPAKLGLPEL